MLKLNVDTNWHIQLEESTPLYNVNVKCNIRLILLMFLKRLKDKMKTILQMKQMIYFVVLFFLFFP